ncbi:glycosyltransferase [Thermus sp.]|uniref:glycosyltransferase n=1 Tax=Thermus sp. TaxID=275 RepID=UPI00307E1166
MRLRVLHVIPDLGPGGAERLLVDLMGAMDKERFEVVAVSLYPSRGTLLEKEAERKALKVFFLRKRKGLDPKVMLQLFRLILDYRPHVIHTHLYTLGYALLPTLLGNIPVRVHTIHTIAQREVNALGKRVHGLAFGKLGVVPVSISLAVAETVKRVYGLDLDTPVIYNGIPTNRFLDARLPPRGEEKLRLLHVARFAPPKNHLVLLEGFATALDEYSSMELWLVGDGPLRREVERQISLRGLQEHVKCLGLRQDVPELMGQVDTVVLSSDWEGAPLVVLEAMASGRPVIATAVGGVPELIEDGVHGFLVPPRNPKAFAEAILRLARNPLLVRQMGQEGRKRALERFDITQTAKAYGELYINLFRARRVVSGA